MKLDFLHRGLVLLDGAMGTVLQQRGLPPGGKPDLLNLTGPDLLYAIYREYIEAGSQIICANTFGASAPKLAGAGHTPDEVMGAARRWFSYCRELASDRPIWRQLLFRREGGCP